MPLPLPTLAPLGLKAILGALQAVPWRILMEVVMLLLIIFLWNGIGDAKEQVGTYKGKLKASQEALVLCQDEKDKLVESSRVTDSVVGDNRSAHAVTDKETQRLLKELREKANAKKCPVLGALSPETPSPDIGIPDGINGLDKLLDSATCAAEQHGVPCTPGKPPITL